MPGKQTMEALEGLQLKILNNTSEDFVLQAQKIEKGKYKKATKKKSDLTRKRALSSSPAKEVAKAEQTLKAGLNMGSAAQKDISRYILSTWGRKTKPAVPASPICKREKYSVKPQKTKKMRES